ncbi:MAG: outer rane transport energization protein ExbD [Candidatus Sulfotelmatobacter sp.]|nr:outer rane transport energization protein ExbD [Candidatus Sulfotelmatobacter sp.]
MDIGTLLLPEVSDVADARASEELSMSFSMAGGGARGPEINVTPLIDVLLTLIIVFMVVVSMDKEQGETAQIPQPDQKQTENVSQPRTVVIQVVWTKENQPPTVKINQDDVRWEDLETRLAEIYLKRAEKVAFVRGDANVDFQYVADVIDVAHHAGVQRVGLLTMDRKLTEE